VIVTPGEKLGEGVVMSRVSRRVGGSGSVSSIRVDNEAGAGHLMLGHFRRGDDVLWGSRLRIGPTIGSWRT